MSLQTRKIIVNNIVYVRQRKLTVHIDGDVARLFHSRWAQRINE